MRYELLGNGAGSLDDADEDELEELGKRKGDDEDEEDDEGYEDLREIANDDDEVQKASNGPSPPKLKLNTF